MHVILGRTSMNVTENAINNIVFTADKMKINAVIEEVGGVYYSER